MDEVVIAIIVGVVIAVLSPLLVLMVRYLGRVVADHLRDGLVSDVSASLKSYISDEVGTAVDSRFQTMEHRVNDIHRELQTNGGDTVKDAIRRIEARQSREAAERRESMSKVWDTLAQHGIERRQPRDDADGSY